MKLLQKNTLVLLSLLAALIAPPALANAGKVIFAFGDVSVERPDPDVLSQGMPVEEGDVIVTGTNGYVQLLLEDETKIAIRPDSRFTILALEMPAGGGFPAIGAGATPRTEFSLQRGGFRTLTGRIAEEEPRSYQVSTPNAVVGIRGTNYVARLCAGDCGSSTEDGLFVGVTTGSVFLSNNAGELDLRRNQFGFARNFNTPPVLLMAPPASLQDEGIDGLIEEEEEEESEEEQTAQNEEDEAESEEEGESEAEEVAEEFGSEGEETETAEASTASDSAPVATTSDGVDQSINSADGADLTGGDNVASNLLAFSTSEFAIATTAGSIDESNGGVSGFRSLGASGAIESYEIGTASDINQGFDPVTELKWGRWSGGTATVDGAAVDLTSSSLHYIVAPSEDVSQTITGSASYVLVGNTDPTDNQGNIGILGDAQLLADFTNMTVQSDLLLSIDNAVWGASGTGDITNALFEGLYDTVTVNGASGASGGFAGVFTGFEGGGLPAGAGMNYNLLNEDKIINGTAIFNRSN